MDGGGFNFLHDGRHYEARLRPAQVNGPPLWFVRRKDDGEEVNLGLLYGDELDTDQVKKRALKEFERRQKPFALGKRDRRRGRERRRGTDRRSAALRVN